MRIDNLLVQSPEARAHGMKLEAEVDSPLCLFTSAERQGEDGGSVDCGAELRSAQGTSTSASIDNPKQLTSALSPPEPPSPGCGCGSTEEIRIGILTKEREIDQLIKSKPNEIPQVSNAESITCNTQLSLSSFACEHIRFIDEDVDETDTPDSKSIFDDSIPLKDTSTRTFFGDAQCIPNGGSDVTDRHLPNCNSATTVEVSGSVCILQPYEQLETLSSDSKHEINGMSVIQNDVKEKTSALRRQVSLDDSGSEENSTSSKQLKSVLKKGRSTEKNGKKGRVTFDEAVTLYSDEFEDVQLLALRSAADVNCAEVFYMFEPPIEYQDLLPFEPPAEYRDIEEQTGEDKKITQSEDTVTEESKLQKEPEQKELILTAVEDVETPQQENHSAENDRKEDIDSAIVVPPADGCDVTVAPETGKTEHDLCDNDPESRELHIEASEETEKLFERFLEAEREFAEDEELNRAFHVLESDFSSDSKNGAFDDNFFKKLINLLSSVEGEVRLEDGDLFSSTDFTVNEDDFCRVSDEYDNDQSRSRTMSEADSDCSGSSQDTIIVRFGDDGNDSLRGNLQRQISSECDLSTEVFNLEKSIQNVTISEESTGTSDDVFTDTSEIENNERQNNVLPTRENGQKTHSVKSDKANGSNNENLSRQNSNEQPPKGSQDTVQDADDSTSSDSRSGEVEEDIRLDDIGYDEEDADDYDEECLRGMAHGNSKIRRIIKKNALQCTLFRGIEARRRQTGAKYPRPKSPLLSQESLVEQIKWLTAMDENKEVSGFSSFNSKPPDVILSAGGLRLNGAVAQNTSSEEDINNRGVIPHRLPSAHSNQPRHLVATNSNGVYIVRQGYPHAQHPRPVRPWVPQANQHIPVIQHQRPHYPSPHPISQPSSAQSQHLDERVVATVRMPGDFRDWRVIQRVMVNRNSVGNDGNTRYQMPTNFRQCPNGDISNYPRAVHPEAGRTLHKTDLNDELEQFVQQDIQRIERIRKRYSVAEDDDDPTFGFARRPSVRVVQNQSANQHQPSDTPAGSSSDTKYVTVNTNSGVPVQGPVLMRSRIPLQTSEQDIAWSRNPNWRSVDPNCAPLYCAPNGCARPQSSMHIHRASVALTELPGCATLPHPKSHTDTRYHSYAENVYGGSQTLPHKRWISADHRTYVATVNPVVNHQVPIQVPLMPPSVPPPPTLQVPPHAQTAAVIDERGVPEGASSSPKVSSDSLYHAPVPETLPVGATHKDDGVIYYSLNV